MRTIISALFATAFAVSATAVFDTALAAKLPAKTTLGCLGGLQTWVASSGTYVATKPDKKATQKA